MSSKGTQPPESGPPAKRGRGRPVGSKNATPTPERSRAKPPPNVERVAFSIPEFCARNGISLGNYRLLQKAGKGPRELRPSGLPHGTVLVTLAEEGAWQRKGQQPIPEEVKAADREKRAKASAAKKAGGAS
ncbi:MAG TPA: hypothetical protein VIF88_04305 [Methylocystis sp.]|jgi:hypothetical protein